MMSARRLAPLRVNRCAAEAVPAQEEKTVRVPVSETEGADPTVTVTVAVLVQPLASVPVTV